MTERKYSTGRVLRILDDIPTLVTEAEATRGTAPISDDGHLPRTVPGSTCLADLDRLLALDPLNSDHGIGVLSSWVLAIHADMDDLGHRHDLPADNVTAACRWLQTHLPYVESRHLHEALWHDLEALWVTLRGICRIKRAKAWPCMADGCQEQADLESSGEHFLCPAGHLTDGPARLERRYRYHPPEPAAWMETEFGVPEGTIRSWRARRKDGLQPYSPPGARPVLYLPWDVLMLRWPALKDALDMRDSA